MRIDREADILGLVDVQPTFMPGGELPVAEGHAVVPIINRMLAKFQHAFATQDWHPPGHASFASAHPGHAPYHEIDMPYGRQVLWPDHGLAGSANAELHRDLEQRKIEVVIRKGFHPTIDSYSTFFENDHRTPTGLDGWLRQRGFRRLILAGLATDVQTVCVCRARDATAARVRSRRASQHASRCASRRVSSKHSIAAPPFCASGSTCTSCGRSAT